MTIRVMVTGATGFVGMQVMRQLSLANVNLIPVVRSGKESLIDQLPNIARVICSDDLFSESSLWWEKECQDVDIVVHVAWYVEPGKYLNSEKNIDCLYGSLNLVKGATKAGIKKFVGIGTCFEYDLSHKLLSIETPLKPSSLYATTKMVLYKFLFDWFKLHSIEFSWCRLFYLYGEGEDHRRLVPYIRERIENGEVVKLGNEKSLRDFLDVKEAGKKIANVVIGKNTGPINICSGFPISIGEIAEKIADEYGRRDLLKFGQLPDRDTDPICVVGVVS